MKIERKTYRDGNLLPEAFNCLKLLPREAAYDREHNERHPFSIYSLSIQKVMQSFNEILDEIDQIHTALFDSTEHIDYRLSKLPGLQEKLLYALQSHIDDCYRVLKVTHPFVPTKERFVEGWLQNVKHPAYKEFRKAVNDYRESFAPIVNKIKHNGGQLRPIVMYSRDLSSLHIP